jgi:hypothetical protein
MVQPKAALDADSSDTVDRYGVDLWVNPPATSYSLVERVACGGWGVFADQGVPWSVVH